MPQEEPQARADPGRAFLSTGLWPGGMGGVLPKATVPPRSRRLTLLGAEPGVVTQGILLVQRNANCQQVAREKGDVLAFLGAHKL